MANGERTRKRLIIVVNPLADLGCQSAVCEKLRSTRCLMEGVQSISGAGDGLSIEPGESDSGMDTGFGPEK